MMVDDDEIRRMAAEELSESPPIDEERKRQEIERLTRRIREAHAGEDRLAALESEVARLRGVIGETVKLLEHYRSLLSIYDVDMFDCWTNVPELRKEVGGEAE